MAESVHAFALVRAFIAPDRQGRYLALLGSTRGREKLRRALAHCRDLDSRFAHELPDGVHTVAEIAALLRAKGAPAECTLLAEDAALDGRCLSLDEALRAVIGRGMGALISCVPGTLGFYEGEGPGARYLLERAI
jgi:hypothetical protein